MKTGNYDSLHFTAKAIRPRPMPSANTNRLRSLVCALVVLTSALEGLQSTYLKAYLTLVATLYPNPILTSNPNPNTNLNLNVKLSWGRVDSHPTRMITQ